jgi:hypothetical protein
MGKKIQMAGLGSREERMVKCIGDVIQGRKKKRSRRIRGKKEINEGK